MHPETLKNGNNLLARLLGWEEDANLNGVWWKTSKCAKVIAFDENRTHMYPELPFHKDWNFLMEIVDTIESMNDGLDELPLKLTSKRLEDLTYCCRIDNDMNVNLITIGNSRRLSVWRTCVKFADYYFEIKK